MNIDVGSQIGDYEVIAPLGTGGMGTVFLARHLISNRTEAIKILNAELTTNNSIIERFLAEIQTTASLDHPNIAKLHTAFRVANQVFMVMEFVDGGTLSQQLKGGALSIPLLTSYCEQLLAALGYAHSLDIIHRDIKPSNIIVTARGTVKLMDFGIAKSALFTEMTQPGTTLGSVHYMSPEQAQGQQVDQRSDLYSLGILLYEMATGRRPFEGSSLPEVFHQHLYELPREPRELNSQISDQLNRLILRALAKNPINRFQSAAEFTAALHANESAYAAPTDASGYPPKAAPTGSAGRTSRRWVGITTALSLTVFFAIAAFLSASKTNVRRHQAVSTENSRPPEGSPTPNGISESAGPSPASAVKPHFDAEDVPTRSQPAPVAERRSFVQAGAPADLQRETTPTGLRNQLEELQSEETALDATIANLRKQLAQEGYNVRPAIVAKQALLRARMDSAKQDIERLQFDDARSELTSAGQALRELNTLLGYSTSDTIPADRQAIQ